jgi:hypothetical protein
MNRIEEGPTRIAGLPSSSTRRVKYVSMISCMIHTLTNNSFDISVQNSGLGHSPEEAAATDSQML